MTTVAKPAESGGPGSHTAAKNDPVLDALARIDRRLAEVERVTSALAPLAEALATAPGAIAAVTDAFDGMATKIGVDGADVDERLRSVLRAVDVSTKPRAVHGLATLIESDLLEPSVLAVLSQLAASLANPGQAKPVGAFGALRALGDRDVQRALGFLLAVARKFGQHLGSGDVATTEQKLLSASAQAGKLESA